MFIQVFARHCCQRTCRGCVFSRGGCWTCGRGAAPFCSSLAKKSKSAGATSPMPVHQETQLRKVFHHALIDPIETPLIDLVASEGRCCAVIALKPSPHLHCRLERRPRHAAPAAAPAGWARRSGRGIRHHLPAPRCWAGHLLPVHLCPQLAERRRWGCQIVQAALQQCRVGDRDAAPRPA